MKDAGLSIVLGLGVLLPGHVHAAETFLAVDTQVSWVSDAEPELHFLLQNKTGQELRFALAMEDATGCKGAVEEIPPYLISSHGFGWREQGTSFGSIAPGAWSHRVVLFGFGDAARGCDVHAFLNVTDVSGKTLVELRPIFRVPNERRALRAVRPGYTARLETKWMVERDRAADSFLLRVFVRNRDSQSLHVGVKDRRLSCAPGGSAWWDLIKAPVKQGIDAGPVALDPQDWTVFVAPIQIDGSANNCRGEIDVAVAMNAGSDLESKIRFETATSVVFRLEPSGEFSK